MRSPLNYLLTIALCFVFTSFLSAQTYTFQTAGDWTTAGNWSPSYPGTNVSGDVIINATCNIPSGTNVVLSGLPDINADLTIEGDLTTPASGIHNDTVLAGVTVTVRTGGSFTHGGRFYYEGNLTVESGATFTALNNSYSQATIYIQPGATFNNSGSASINDEIHINGTLVNSGTFSLDGSIFYRLFISGQIENTSTGVIDVLNGAHYRCGGNVTNDGVINNHGSWVNNPCGIFSGAGDYISTASRVFLIVEAGSQATPIATPIYQHPNEVQIGSNNPAYNTSFDIAGNGGPGAPNGHDQIQVTNDLNIVLNNINIDFGSFIPNIGDSYQLFTAGGNMRGGLVQNNQPIVTPSTIQGTWDNATATFTVTQAPPQPNNAIPTLSQWGLILLGLGVVAMGTVVVWRRRSGSGSGRRIVTN